MHKLSKFIIQILTQCISLKESAWDTDTDLVSKLFLTEFILRKRSHVEKVATLDHPLLSSHLDISGAKAVVEEQKLILLVVEDEQG